MNPLFAYPRPALLSVALFCVSNFSAQALTLQEAYALKGSGQVATELLLSASGAPKGDAMVSALARPGQGGRLLTDLNRLGLMHGAQAGRLVTGRLPLSAVPKLAGLASLHSIRPSHALFLAADPGAGRQGSIVSQGDTEMYAAAARTRFQVDGTGVKVGVLSDSFNCGALNPGSPEATPYAIETGNVPSDVQVLKEADCYIKGGTDEGRNMLEVIHDLAPGAALAFHTANNGAADMAQGIRALADAGATVIVDDTIHLEEPVYQDGGPIADAVKDVVARGVSYVAAAGNFGRKTYEAPFRPSGVTVTVPEQAKEWKVTRGPGPNGNDWSQALPGEGRGDIQRVSTPARTIELHDFDPGPEVDTCQRITVYGGGFVALTLHWDQPYASFGNGPGASTDMDVFLMDEDCREVYQIPFSPAVGLSRVGYGLIGVGASDNLGADPVEVISVVNDQKDPEVVRTFGVAIGRTAGPAPTRLRITYASGNKSTQSYPAVQQIDRLEAPKLPPETIEYSQDSPGIFGHANLPEAITAGAVRVQMKRDSDYVLGGSGQLIDTGLHQTEPFSALGGTALLFDEHGQPLAQPIHRRKPDVAGLDGAEHFTRSDWRPIGDGFYGTSAAAAHVGGLVALARQAAPAATPGQIAEALRATAIDLDDTLTPGADTGFDFATGHGLADG
ncbi:S8 family serine peptidase, partial [Methylomagnum sp.]